MNGTIFNIEHYAIHDGPGIRTTVFFKGCPLACLWCHNPEGLSVKPQIVYYRQRCVGCKKCVSLCAAGALSPRDGGISLDAGKCRLCGRCTENCPAEALEKVGRSVTAEEVVAEAEKDRIFYEESGGGVTFSGGEPFLQADFLRECLTLTKTRELHTAVETSGFAPREAVEKAAPYVDLFLFDVKHIRAAEHRKYTGADNAPIKANLRRLSELGKEIVLRMVVIPNVNDDKEALEELCRFLRDETSVRTVNLLPLHKSASEKYRRLGIEFAIEDFETPDDERMAAAARVFAGYGFRVLIGGQ